MTDLTTEKTILASMMVDEDALIAGMDCLKEEMFYSSDHKTIYKAIEALYRYGVDVDPLTVVNELNGQIDPSTALSLVEENFTVKHIESYIKILDDQYKIRRLKNLAAQINVGLETTPSEDLLDQAEQELFNIRQNNRVEEWSGVNSVIQGVLEDFREAMKTDGPLGLSTGYAILDKYLTGFHPGDLVILAARPSMGKTALSLNIAESVAKAGTGVAYFSMEMTKAQLVTRMACGLADVNMSEIRAKITQEEYDKINEASYDLSQWPIYIDDNASLNIVHIKSKLRKILRKNPIGLMVIDYLGLMRPVVKSKSKVHEIEEITQGLKQLAKEFSIPALVLCQLSRRCEERADKRPMLSDLRDSGAIEQDADVVMSLFREEVYEANSDNYGKAELIINKQRNGMTGTIPLTFIKEKMLFKE